MPAIGAVVGVSRIEVSARWYAATLGMAVERAYDADDAHPSVRLERDGFRLDLLPVPAGWAIPRSAEQPAAVAAWRATATGLIQLAFLVPDLDAAIRRVGAFQAVVPGSRLLHAPRVDAEWGVRFATVTDPDGGVVQLAERIAVHA